MLIDELEQLRNRKDYYRDFYRRFLNVSFYCFIIILLLLLGIVYLSLSRYIPAYYATSSDGSLWKIRPDPWGTRLPEPVQALQFVQPQQQQQQQQQQ